MFDLVGSSGHGGIGRRKGLKIPFFGKKGLSEITGGLVNEYRMHRIADAKERWGKPPARTTMHQRPDEILRLEYRDVTVAFDEGTQETILEIEVRGKRGYGPCKSN